MNDASILDRLDRLESSEAIRRKLHLYCRGIDRRDAEILRQTFWPGSRTEYGVFAGDGLEFANQICGWMDDGGFAPTQHMLGNVALTLDGDVAHTESYLQAFHHLRREDGTIYDWIVGGRYQDRFERRDGEWRISFRRLIFEWYRDWPDTRDWADGLMGINNDTAAIGKRAPDDWLKASALQADLQPTA